MTLNNIKKDQKFKVDCIIDKSYREQGIRLGLFDGALVQCTHKLPGGPIIIKTGMQVIAIGRNLAKNIIIS